MNMTPAERMHLMRFVCSFVWTDLRVHQLERDMVMRAAGRLELTNDETAQVREWLRVPPEAEEVDPTKIPVEHRRLFLQAAEAAIRADGRVVPAERESIALFRELLDA